MAADLLAGAADSHARVRHARLKHEQSGDHTDVAGQTPALPTLAERRERGIMLGWRRSNRDTAGLSCASGGPRVAIEGMWRRDDGEKRLRVMLRPTPQENHHFLFEHVKWTQLFSRPPRMHAPPSTNRCKCRRTLHFHRESATARSG